MGEDLIKVLREHDFQFHTRVRGASGRCWYVGSQRGDWDHGERRARSFLALSEAGGSVREIRFRFSVTRSALASTKVRERLGNIDVDAYLIRAGVSHLKRLLEQDDGANESYPKRELNSRSPLEEYDLHDDEDLDREIARVRTAVLEVLRRNAYLGLGRTMKADVIENVCTSDVTLDRVLLALEKKKQINGALRGEMRITEAGEAELERIRELQSAEKRTGGSARRMGDDTYDVFISHASEDKDGFVRPFAHALRGKGVKVWYDEFSLSIGDSLRESIDRGLARSRFGVVVLSTAFFKKDWPRLELNGLFATMKSNQKKLLPVWHEIDRDEVAVHSPMVADLLAVRTSEGLNVVVEKIIDVVTRCAR